VITFLHVYAEMEFLEAVRYLADRLNIPLPGRSSLVDRRPVPVLAGGSLQ
jgi:hypothetical protein